jgi:hypothetical protein
MGGGSWDSGTYHSTKSTRAANNVPDFAYTQSATNVHANLDPKRINKKPFGKLESRDSADHPESHAVLVCFDVTGSNIDRAVDVQKKLPTLMELLAKYIADPQVAVAANDDYKVVGTNSIQISDFESDIRVDEHIRNIWLVGNGGGNNGESYDLLLYAAARKMVLDSVEKRSKKGYMFLYADELVFPEVLRDEVSDVFGDKLESDIPTVEIIEEAQRNFHIFVIWPRGGEDRAHEQYKKLFGEENVLVSQHPNLLCELIASTVALYENKPADVVVNDLIAIGVGDADAKALVKRAAHSASTLATSGGDKAARL